MINKSEIWKILQKLPANFSIQGPGWNRAAELILVLLMTLLTLQLVVVIPLNLVNWNIPRILAQGTELLFCCTAPEPLERSLFLGSLIVLPFALLFNGWLVCRTKTGRWFLQSRLFVFLLVTGSYIALIKLLQTGFVEDDMWGYYFGQTALVRKMKTFWILSMTIFFVLVFTLRKPLNSREERLQKFAQRTLHFTLATLSLTALIICTAWSIFPLKVIGEGVNFTSHYEAVLYSVSQVMTGKALLTDNFRNTYGLYPHFLGLFFKFTGFGIVQFNIAMAVLIFVSFSSMLICIKSIYKNSIFGWLTFLFISVVLFIANKISTGDHYFAYQPLRLVFPALIFVFGVNYAFQPRLLTFWATTLLSSMAILWQPDSGFAAALSWCGLLVYMALQGGFRDNWRAFCKIPVIFLTGVVFWFAYQQIIFLLYGTVPDFRELFSSIMIFSKLGYFMIEMPVFHPWNGVLLTYTLALTYAVVSLYKSGGDQCFSRVLFFVGLLGFGLFAYYQGRSHPSCLIGPIWPFVIIFGFIGDRIASYLMNHGLHPVPMFAGMLPIVLFLALGPSTLFSWGYEPWAWPLRQFASFTNTVETPVSRDLAFLKENTHQGEEILILSAHQAVFHSETGTLSAYNPGLVDLLLKSDMTKLLTTIEHGRATKIFLKYPFGTIGANIQAVSSWKSFEEIFLASGYVFLKKSTDGMMFFQRVRDL